MRSLSSALVVLASLVSVVSLGYAKQNFGEVLCENMDRVASHSTVLQRKGNRTTCVISITRPKTGKQKVDYFTAVGTIIPLKKATFDIKNLGPFELVLTNDCALDPCFKVENSPGGKFDGNHVYCSPGMVNNELKFVTVYDCRNKEKKTEKAEFYEASPEIVQLAKNRYGMDLSLSELQKCVKDAAAAAAKQTA